MPRSRTCGRPPTSGTRNGTSTVIAIRGQRLALVRIRLSGDDQRPDAFHTEMLGIVEINADSRMATRVLFGVDDIDAAIAELDARYIAGEAAAHAEAWSLIARGFAAVNRRELPATAPNWVNIDHRRARAFAPGELSAYFHAGWDLTSDVKIYVESVHRLSNRGSVVTYAAQATSRQGFDAEWREIQLLTVEGDLVTRCELFDEADLDTAIATFDELSRPAPRLENAASRVEARCQAYIAAGDWDAMATVMADDISIDDRRRVVNAGLRRGRDAVIDDLRVGAEIGLTEITPTAIAIRGEGLTLGHIRYWGGGQPAEPGLIDLVQLVEIDAEERISALVLYDPDDVEAAFAELDTRYAAGEAAQHAHTWSVVTENVAAFNRHEFPASTPDVVNVDHRRVTAFASGDVTAYVRETWEQTPDLKIYIESVHRLNDICAVFTYVATGTSQQGFTAEWRAISASIIDGDLIKRSERFDEVDLDAALARFDELSLPRPRLENGASRLIARFQEVFGIRDWDGMAEIFADDICLHDRRQVVGASFVGRDATMANMRASAETGVKNVTSTVMASRGSRLALHRVQISGRDQRPEAFRTDALVITEVDGQDRIIAFSMFDLDETEAAFEELDARYLAGRRPRRARRPIRRR